MMTQVEWLRIFSGNLKDILKEKGVSQKQLSYDTGVSTGMISNYINGRSIPSVPVAINIAYALDMEIGELIDFDDRIEM